jgi:hypothetical protein
MLNTKTLTRNLALTGALTLLFSTSSFAQSGYGQRTRPSQRYANRVVEGTVQSVEVARNGERVRLTNGMDLVVPNSIVSTNQGRRYGAATLRPGDVVRMNVYSREGDGRDAQVRSLEILQTDSFYSRDRRLTGTVVSFDRRDRALVMRTDNGRTLNINLGTTSRQSTRFREGDRISVSGRMDRGTLVVDDIDVVGGRR